MKRDLAPVIDLQSRRIVTAGDEYDPKTPGKLMGTAIAVVVVIIATFVLVIYSPKQHTAGEPIVKVPQCSQGLHLNVDIVHENGATQYNMWCGTTAHTWNEVSK